MPETLVDESDPPNAHLHPAARLASITDFARRIKPASPTHRAGVTLVIGKNMHSTTRRANSAMHDGSRITGWHRTGWGRTGMGT